MITARRTCLTVALCLVLAATARAEDPPLPSSRDPGGTAVAILADGFDYTAPDLARHLARDGEGEAIAWDAVDGDGRPFSANAQGTALAKSLTSLGGVRIIPVRVNPDDAASLAKGLAFAAQTPASIGLVALPEASRTGLDVLVAATKRFPDLVIVGAIPALSDTEKERAAEAGSLVLLDAGQDGLAAASAVARVLGCKNGPLNGVDGEARKREFLERLNKAPAAGCN